MTRWGKSFVLSCCLFMAAEAASRNCWAQAQDKGQDKAPVQEASAVQPANESGAKRVSGDAAKPRVQPAIERESWREHDNSLGPHLLKDLASDQKEIWASPFHLRMVDADWLVPLGLATGAMLGTDTEVSKHLSISESRQGEFKTFSDFGIASMAGAAGGLYLWGHMTHDDHKRETGLLAGEAAANSLAVTYAFKYGFGRERPLEDNYQGRFGQGGDSFPSEHAAAAWSIASVVAHEYPGPLTQILAYGLASAVSASRVNAKQHFPSDVLIGSAIGWFTGWQTYRKHHDPELGGDAWETYKESRDEGPGRPTTSSKGSPYMELDSWIYPALERLGALGYIQSEFLGLRPWTRIECAHLIEEAGDQMEAEGESDSREAAGIYDALEREFHEELNGGSERSIRLESIYAGVTGIAGPPLDDSYHFGQTIINNYGRPYQEGFNSYDGFSGYATEGRFVIYVRGEYQHAPSAPAYSQTIRNAIAVMDINPVQPAIPIPAANQFRLLDTYVAASVGGWDLAFGKQSLWWGPGEGGPLLFSDNAEPIYAFRASRIEPSTLPWVFHWLGPMKWDLFVGKLSGNEFPPRPLLHGETISFKPSPNLELGFSRTAEFGGVGRPLTPAAFWNSYTAFNLSSAQYASNDNPGKRTGGAHFSYRIPHLRNWLTVYSGSLADDDASPLQNPPRAAYDPGFYMPRLPGLPKLDFRFEAVYTDLPIHESVGGHFVYYDGHYHDLYTNKNNIIGSWIGREGQGIQAWSTYWFSSRNSLQLGFRHAEVSKDFLPGGETANDGSARINWWVHDVSLSGSVQYERWLAPILATGPQTNWTASFQIGFWPRSWSK